jgi:GNAT superfamily N-acetyltransferase
VTPAIWVAGPEDAGAVAGLMGEFRDWYGYERPGDATVAASVRRLLADPNADFLLAAHAAGEAPAGVCQMRYRHSIWTDADDCWLEDLFVREADQRRGLGTALVAAALERARERGCRRVELDVDEGRTAAREMYRRLGFTEHSKTEPPDRTLLIAHWLRPR